MAEKVLAKPYELYDVGDGDILRTRIIGWELGQMVIHPNRGTKEKVVDALRLFVPEDDKEFFPYYWDVTATTLIAQLVGYLQRDNYKSYQYIIQKHGVRPRARFSLKVEPL